MTRIILKKSIFDNYFNLLYKIEYNNLIGKESSEQDYKQMDIITAQLKKQIKKVFLSNMELTRENSYDCTYYRLNYVDLGDYYNPGCGKVNTRWIETNTKAKLYYYLLFAPDDTTILSECIDYWFSEGYGYFPDNSKLQLNHIIQDQMININLLDPIGFMLKTIIRKNNLDHKLSAEEIKSIYTYELNKDGTNKTKYSEYLEDFDKYFPVLPKVYNGNGNGNVEDYVDLIDLFDIFFSFDKGKSTNPKINNKLWIETTNNNPYNVIQLDKSENEQNDESWISDIPTDIEPVQFVKKIKAQIEKLNLELKSTDNSGQKELKDNFLTDLYNKLDEFVYAK